MEWTRSLPLTKEEGRERAAAAASPQPLSLGSAAAEGFGENPARSRRRRSQRRLSRGVPIPACPLPAAPKGAGRMNFTRACKIGLSPKPRPPRPGPDPLARGLVSWLRLSTSPALCCFKGSSRPAREPQPRGPCFSPPWASPKGGLTIVQTRRPLVPALISPP